VFCTLPESAFSASVDLIVQFLYGHGSASFVVEYLQSHNLKKFPPLILNQVLVC
jgi:hypothetical protein